jgi:hypothetical protein
MAAFTEVVRSLMSERGVSVRGLAAQVSYDQGGLSKIVAAAAAPNRRPTPSTYAAHSKMP